MFTLNSLAKSITLLLDQTLKGNKMSTYQSNNQCITSAHNTYLKGVHFKLMM